MVTTSWRCTTPQPRRRRGRDGATLLICETYRWKGHSRSDANRYRTKEEIADWQKRCPIARFRAHLEKSGILDAQAAAVIEKDALAQFPYLSPVC
jgi:pyruvate dehydrogenase E1 component alpha subunit